MNNITQIIFIFIGAGMGGIARFSFGKIALQIFGNAFPLGTLGVNIIGSFFIGIAAGILSKQTNYSDFIQYFFMIGFLGGFTTFSTFSLDILRLFENGRLLEAFAYILLSVILSIFAVFVGMVICQKFV